MTHRPSTGAFESLRYRKPAQRVGPKQSQVEAARRRKRAAARGDEPVTEFDAPMRVLQSGGFSEFYTVNELGLISTIDDPPKLRLASLLGLSMGALSWNRVRRDGAFIRQLETILIQGKQDERTRYLPSSDPRTLRSEITVHLNRGGEDDRDMVLVWLWRFDGMWTPFTGWIGTTHDAQDRYLVAVRVRTAKRKGRTT